MTTELEACKLWIQREFSNIPQGLVMKAYSEDVEEIELIEPSQETWLGVYREDYDSLEDAEDGYYEDYDSSPFPMWGTYFHPDSVFDQEWLRDHAKEVYLKCGICTYCTDETGLLLGINGAGYNFYDSHWLKLYRLRGLKWHDEE